jgi:hypothetical protein
MLSHTGPTGTITLRTLDGREVVRLVSKIDVDPREPDCEYDYYKDGALFVSVAESARRRRGLFMNRRLAALYPLT